MPVIATAALAAGVVPARTEPTTALPGASNDADISENEIVVTGFGDIVVNGRARRCRPLAGDPLSDVRVGGGWGDHMMIVPDGRGGYVGKLVTEQITGPKFWQRVGVGMGAYRFRAPSGGKPMC